MRRKIRNPKLEIRDKFKSQRRKFKRRQCPEAKLEIRNKFKGKKQKIQKKKKTQRKIPGGGKRLGFVSVIFSFSF
jgi:hypothetical protein